MFKTKKRGWVLLPLTALWVVPGSGVSARELSDPCPPGYFRRFERAIADKTRVAPIIVFMPDGPECRDAEPGDPDGCKRYCKRLTKKEITPALQMCAGAAHRAWHSGWHTIRDPHFQESKNGLPKGPPSHVGLDCQDPRLRGSPPTNVSGEDFFFMHNRMVRMERQTLAKAGSPCIDPLDIMQAVKSNQRLNVILDEKAGTETLDYSKEIQNAAREITTDAHLRKVTLSQFGAEIEQKVHNFLHVHFAAKNGNLPCPNDRKWISAQLAKKPKDFKPDKGRDLYDQLVDGNIECNYLGSTSSSQVNPIFWHIHGWVDRQMDNWAKANGYDSIREHCGTIPKCYSLRGTWAGDAPMKFPSDGIVYDSKNDPVTVPPWAAIAEIPAGCEPLSNFSGLKTLPPAPATPSVPNAKTKQGVKAL